MGLVGLLIDKVADNILHHELVSRCSIEGDNELPLVCRQEALCEDDDDVLAHNISTNVLELEGEPTDICDPGPMTSWSGCCT